MSLVEKETAIGAGDRNPETEDGIEFKIQTSRFKIGERLAASGQKIWFGVHGTW